MAKQPDYSQWLSEEETAERLRVSIKELQRWAKAGVIRTFEEKRPKGRRVIRFYCPRDIEFIDIARDPLSSPRPKHVYMPNTLPGNRKYHTYVKLLTHVDPHATRALGFEGRLLWCGARVASDQLSPRPVVLEHAGPEGNQKPRQHLWILWRYDWQARAWIDIARARDPDWGWAIALRSVAIRELETPLRPNVIPTVSGGRLAGELLAQADTRLADEPLEVQAAALDAMYTGLAGRIVRLEKQRSERQLSAAAFGPGRAESADGKDTSPKKVLETEAG